jgi:hypothetical protein
MYVFAHQAAPAKLKGSVICLLGALLLIWYIGSLPTLTCIMAVLACRVSLHSHTHHTHMELAAIYYCMLHTAAASTTFFVWSGSLIACCTLQMHTRWHNAVAVVCIVFHRTGKPDVKPLSDTQGWLMCYGLLCHIPLAIPCGVRSAGCCVSRTLSATAKLAVT